MRYRLVAFVLAFTVFAPWCEAVADDDGGDTAAVAANRGFKLGLAPTSLLPIRPLAPFGAFGAGFGGLSNLGESGLALLAGGGLMLHFGRVFAIGAEVTYQTVIGTEFHSVAIGPAIAFGG